MEKEKTINDVILNSLVNDKPKENKDKLVFLVRDKELAEALMSCHVKAILIYSEKTFDNICDFLLEKSSSTSSGASYVNEYYYIPYLFAELNKEFRNKLEKYLKISFSSTKIFEKDKDLSYYINNLEALTKSIDKFIENNFDNEKDFGNDFYFQAKDGKINISKEKDLEKLSRYLIIKYGISRIDGDLHFYDNKQKFYPALTEKKINSIMIKEFYNSRSGFRTEVYKYVITLANKKVCNGNEYILFNNCFIHLKDKRSEVVSLKEGAERGIVTINKVPHNYNAHIFNDSSVKMKVDKFFNDLACNDKELVKLLIQVIGFTLYQENKIANTFFLVGNGSNGKSTYLKLIKHILEGDEPEFKGVNVSHKQLSDLSDKNELIHLRNKLLNISDDEDNTYLKNVGTLKRIVSGETITARALYENAIEFTPYCKMYVSCNDIPRMSDKTDGMGRRQVIVPFNAKFKGSFKKLDILKTLKDKNVTEYIICLAIIELQQIINNGGFTLPKVVKEAIEEYRRDNDPLIDFIEEYEHHFLDYTPQEIYSKFYSHYVMECGYHKLGRNSFFKEMKAKGYEHKRVKINTKVVRRFMSKDIVKSAEEGIEAEQEAKKVFGN